MTHTATILPFLLVLHETTANKGQEAYRDESTLEDFDPRPASAVDASGDDTMITEVKAETTDDN